ncbi:MAG TPA: permease [bacterium]|nr:permease [bacterium]HPG47102.1 permease [bacterium]HPM99574.1 permease [bacterium]
MKERSELKRLLVMTGLFVAVYYLPVGTTRFDGAVHEALALARWYAREHVILCLIPAFFIAGVISVFISQASVIKYLGSQAKMWAAYAVASVSGSILAVCSCTILPLFASIYKRGAGLGPAVAFLYSGPAINILAIILTARILGPELGIARVVGAVSFSVIVGLLMQFFFRKEEKAKRQALVLPEAEESRPLWQTAYHFFVLVAILVFANWGRPADAEGFWLLVWQLKWWITGFFGLLYVVSLLFVLKLDKFQVVLASGVTIGIALLFRGRPIMPFMTAVALTAVLLSRHKGEPQDWLHATWDFAKQILPLLAAGVLVAGFLLGSPNGGDGVIPANWISRLVGGNSLFANFFASIVGAFMYFATLTEIPILQGLMANGMGKGPALALLLAGPALSLPNMLVIRSVMGMKKTVVFVMLVVIMATISGFLFGEL